MKIISGIKALSIRNPWAWLIVHGYKDVENRDWMYKPRYRGPLVIHASQTFDYKGYGFVEQEFPQIDLPGVHEFISGGFMGICRLNDVVDLDDSPWFFGPLGFKLRMAKPIEFIPWPGQLGLWDVPDEIIEKIRVKQ